MNYFQGFIKNKLEPIKELLPSLEIQCGGCLPLALTFEESVQRCAEIWNNENNFVLSLVTDEYPDFFNEEVFVDVWVIKSLKGNEIMKSWREKNKSPADGTISIYLTHELKDHTYFHLNKDFNEKCVLLRRVTPIPLKRITIGALSVAAFNWAIDSLADYLINIINHRLVIIKQNSNLGEVFEQNDMLSMLVVLDTMPVMQGLVNEETALVISDIHRDDLGKMKLKRLKSIQGGGHIPRLPSLKMPVAQKTPLQVNIGGNDDLDEIDAPFIKSHSMKILTTVKVSLLETPCYSEFISGFDQVADTDNQIWIKRDTMECMGLNPGTWVYCNINCEIMNDSEIKQLKRKLAQVFPVDEHPSSKSVWENPQCIVDEDERFLSKTAYVSPVFFFNLCHWPCKDVNSVSLCIERAEIRESPPSFASEISVSVVVSPLTKIISMYDVIINKYFSTPRLVSAGDVLAINCDWKKLEQPNTQVALDDGLPRNHILYMKVQNVVGSDKCLSYFIDSRHSKCFQNEDVVQSFVPSSGELFVSNSSRRGQKTKKSFWLSSYPGGLERHVFCLEDSLRSLLETRSNVDVYPILVSGPVGVGKRTVIMAASRRLNLQVVEMKCYEICSDTTAATEAKMRNMFHKAFSCAPCVLLMSSIHALGKTKDNQEKEPRIITTLMLNLQEIQRVSPHPVLVLATTSKLQTMTSDLRSCFMDEFQIEAPSESERTEMLKGLSIGYLVGPDVSFKALASRTAGMVLADFCTMFSEAVVKAQEDVMEYVKDLNLFPSESHNYNLNRDLEIQRDICSAGLFLHQSHFDKAVQVLQSAHADSIGAPKIPNVCWKDIGGLSNVKQEIMDTIQLPFQYPELFVAGMQRSGILLYGPPGTGKTLVAKAVATECSLNFLSVKGPELINMYVGQSEENVREIFVTASRAAPCVIFFDELDSLAPNRGRSGDSGGVMDRVVSQLLAELDGLNKSSDVFVIGATNRPDLLDPALLRPGRFDKLLYLGICKEKEDKLKIMNALTRKFDLPKAISLDEIVDKCPSNLTGADFYALCSNALLNAIRRQIRDPNEDKTKAKVTQEDFEMAVETLVPSVSPEELRHYEKIQREFNKDKLNEAVAEVGELELDGKLHPIMEIAAELGELELDGKSQPGTETVVKVGELELDGKPQPETVV